VKTARNSFYHLCILPCLWCVLTGVAAAAEVQPAGWDDVQLAGSADRLWVVLTEPGAGDQPPVACLYCRDAGQALRRPQPSAEADLTGRVVRLAAAGGSVHLIFETGGHTQHTGSQLVFGPRLPAGSAVLAMTGCADSDGVWAILEGKTLHALTSQPTTTASGPATRPVAGWVLARLENGVWRHIAPIGDWLDPAATVALCDSAGGVQVFWQSRRSDPVRQTTWTGKAWSQPAVVPLDAPAELLAAVQVNRQLALVVSPPAEDTSGRTLLPVRWVDGQWRRGELLAIGDHPATFDLSTTGVAGMGSRLYVGWLASPDRVQIGAWPIIGGRPAGALMTIAAPQPRLNSFLGQALWQWVMPALMLALLALMVLRRQDALTRVLSPGEGRVLAEWWRRLLAGAIDLLPFAVIGIWVTWAFAGDELRAWSWGLQESGSQQGRPQLPEAVSLAWRAVRGAYCLYALLMELATGSTFGKRWLGCTVSSETGARPGVWALIIRNVIRWVELEFAFVIVPVFLMIITRSHQRLGDILARTIVHRPADEEQLPSDKAGDEAS
jgi:uncharacterized RDD family membrane protein YckC